MALMVSLMSPLMLSLLVDVIVEAVNNLVLDIIFEVVVVLNVVLYFISSLKSSLFLWRWQNSSGRSHSPTRLYNLARKIKPSKLEVYITRISEPYEPLYNVRSAHNHLFIYNINIIIAILDVKMFHPPPWCKYCWHKI